VEYGVTRGIQSSSKMRINRELMDVARKRGFTMPNDYYPAQFVYQFLINDFEKFRHCYTWAPDPEKLEMTNRVYNRIFAPFDNSSTLEFDEAVLKCDRSRACGFPFDQLYASRGEFIDSELDLLRNIVYQILETGKCKYFFNGKWYDKVYWKTSPKEEIRPMEKLANPDDTKNKIRTFMCCDMVMYVIGLMLYSKQNDNMLLMANMDHWSFVGGTMFYNGWHRLAMILKRNLDEQFACYDVQHMEASLNDYIQEVIYDSRDAGIQGFENLKQFYRENLMYSWIIDVDGNLILKTGKNPSGALTTLIDNTKALVWVNLYCFSKLCNSEEELMKLYIDIACKLLGDDSIIADGPHLIGYEKSAKEIGFTLKLERPVGKLEECVFLNQNFVWDARRSTWLFKPNISKLMASLYYNFKRGSWRLAYVKLCSFRMMVWPFVSARAEVDYLLSYIIVNHDDDMRREKNDLLSYEAARSQWKDDSDIQFLLFGDEIVSGYGSNVCTPEILDLD
jgi:hypothetical protein